VTVGDVLDYLALDFGTSAILVYTEGVDSARRFMSGLRAAARIKPVVMLKAGREHDISRAAATHTASLLGSDAVFESALRRAGAVRVTSLPQLFSAAELLSERRRSAGPRLAVVTNAGGVGVLAADAVAEHGLSLAKLSEHTVQGLSKILPVHWTRANPVNLMGDADAERYAAALRTIVQDENVDGAIALVTPLAQTVPLAVARALAAVSS